MFKGFRDFILRGNVLDLAVGVIMGGAFGAVVTSLVKDCNHSDHWQPRRKARLQRDCTQSRHGRQLPHALIAFLMVAASVYFFIVMPANALMNRFMKPVPDVPPQPKTCPDCLSEIRCCPAVALTVPNSSLSPDKPLHSSARSMQFTASSQPNLPVKDLITRSKYPKGKVHLHEASAPLALASVLSRALLSPDPALNRANKPHRKPQPSRKRRPRQLPPPRQRPQSPRLLQLLLRHRLRHRPPHRLRRRNTTLQPSHQPHRAKLPRLPRPRSKHGRHR